MQDKEADVSELSDILVKLDLGPKFRDDMRFRNEACYHLLLAFDKDTYKKIDFNEFTKFYMSIKKWEVKLKE